MIELPLAPAVGARLLLLSRMRVAGGLGSGRYPKGSSHEEDSGLTPTMVALKKSQGTTDNPNETGFVLPDGTRIRKAFADEHQAVAGGREPFRQLMREGVVRYIPRIGIEASAPITSAQARLIADDFKIVDYSGSVWARGITVDVSHPRDIGTILASQHFSENRLTADSIRNFISRGLATPSLKVAGGPGSGRYPKGSHTEALNQQMRADRQKNPLAHPSVVLDTNPLGQTRYIAAYGQEFKSAKLPKGIPQGNPNECYRNAALLAAEHPELRYTEGFVNAGIGNPGEVAFLHAWNTTSNGTVVDNTLENPQSSHYFGIVYNRENVLGYMAKQGVYGVLGGTNKGAREIIKSGAKELRSNIRGLGGAGSGDHGHAGRKGEIGGSSKDDGGEVFYSSPKEAYHLIADGQKASVMHDDVRKVLEHAVKHKDDAPVDLTHLTVDKTALFAGGLNEKRATMPQIDEDHQKAFLKALDEQGIKVKYENVRPSSLLPMQNEINAARVGKKLEGYDKGQKDLTPITITRDNFVCDGHHRWAAMTALDVESPSLRIKMPAMRIMADHGKVLSVMRDFMKTNHIKYAALQRWMAND